MQLFRYGIGVALGLAIATQSALGNGAPQAAGLKVIVIEGEDAVNIIQQKTAVAPVVEVRDRNNQPVAGAVVRFAIQGGRASFSGARTLTVTTNIAGRAAVTGLTPTTSGAFQITASAAFQGQTAAATIAQTNVMTLAQAAGAGGASSAGAGGGASGGGGGLSATTIGIVGGAVAGGALLVPKVLDVVSGGTTYKGPFHIDVVSVSRTTLNGNVTASCTWNLVFEGTLTIVLDGQGDGSHTGNFKAEWTQTEVGRTCPNPVSTGVTQGPSTISGDISGTSANLQFTRENREPASGTARLDWVSVMSFSGALNGDAISGTWSVSSLNTLVVFNTPGEGYTEGYPATSAPVTLTKQ